MIDSPTAIEPAPTRLPPIDVEAPTNVDTATFALG